MTREGAIKELRRLHYAYKADEHGDYFYDNADDVCQAASVAIAALREQEELESKLRALESSGWISVEDRLPEESTEVLSFFCVRKIDGTWERYTATAIRLCGAKWLVSDYQNGIEAYSWGADIEDCCFRVTHWMPLPEAPKEEV